MRSILVDQNSITFFTNCDYEYDSCKGATKTLYERKLTRAESSGYYNFLRKLNLKDIQGKFEDPNDNSGYQINITVSGDELMRREITLYNATFAQTDSIIQKTNDLIADEKYKFFLKK
ncbi:MAG TPA: hypothetical protein VK177_21400 [Flavobacteriales bacterium]|nr:hypothetical protein [Flavobacteriales bacterium]